MMLCVFAEILQSDRPNLRRTQSEETPCTDGSHSRSAHTHTHRPSKHCLIFTCSHFNAAWIKQRLDEIEHLKIWTSCLERLFMGRSGCINDISNQLNKKEAGFWHKGTSFQARFVQRGQHLFVFELTYIACFLYRLISNQIINKPFSIGRYPAVTIQIQYPCLQ